MARNYERKVRCDPGQLIDVKQRALTAGAEPFVTLAQTDVYFATPNGRLKVREIAPEQGAASAELIGYRRPNAAASRWSDYERVELPAGAADGVKRALAATCDVLEVVAKRREVGILGHTRIHLDTVERLGSFVELETVVDGDHDAEAESEHLSIVWQLGLDGMPALAGSYSDLIMDRASEGAER